MRNLITLRGLYFGKPEIVVVNDGSDDLPATPDDVTVVQMPPKNHALNPCTAINAGVAVARGSLIVLTNPEVIHDGAILQQMADSCGPRDYVSASCWSPGRNWWYAHSTKGPSPRAVGRASMPAGSAFHFCAMLHRTLYDEIGGFSEEYRDGQAYEDNDFLWKLHAAGANFVIRDDLVTEHIDCPPTTWPPGGAARNRAIFEAKWIGIYG